jgi:hypothetical protein
VIYIDILTKLDGENRIKGIKENPITKTASLFNINKVLSLLKLKKVILCLKFILEYPK